MNNIPKRKHIRIEDYDYSTPGAYFITVCTANREKLFWEDVGADICQEQHGLQIVQQHGLHICSWIALC